MDAIFHGSAKVLIVDPSGRVLLFNGLDPACPEERPVWFAVGGGLEPGEAPREAAIREVREETGQALADLGPVVLTRRFHWSFGGTVYDQDETYFLARTPYFEPSTSGWSDLEREAVIGHRWWSADELRTTDETVFPIGLADLLDEQAGR